MGKCRTYIGTYNNPTEDPAEWIEALHNKSEAQYTVGQLEKGAEGTVHIQFALYFKTQRHFTAVKKLAPKCHFEEVKKDNGVDAYCMKEDTRLDGPWEHGIKPAKQSAVSKVDYDQVIECCK